jgi:hypothetical protein
MRSSALAATAVSFAPRTGAGESNSKQKLFSAMEIAASLDRAAALEAEGADFLTENTSAFLVPDQADDVFAKNLAKLANSPLPVLSCNGFIRPKHLRCVGAEVTPLRI